ncbi:MAG TPA: glycosyltransferase family 2 protein [Solirubrobacterales bacterium]|nr:glycosyltransferase family 2 protein [Solirubrobacterales bacterium]
MRLIGLTRVRNEAQVIRDTLEHLDSICDGIVVYDDCSTDETAALVERSPAKILRLIRGRTWSPDRLSEETRHRAILMRSGIEHGADWLLYLDADERIACDLRRLAESAPPRVAGFRLGLLDAYLTSDLADPYEGGRLEDLPRLYGPEQRRILMLWRSSRPFAFLGSDQREPVPGIGCRIADGPTAVKHFGKAISVAQWEESCAYYAGYFPEPYRTKWAARVGRAIHAESDFGGPLMSWSEAVAGAVAVDRRRPTLRMLARRLQVSLGHRAGGGNPSAEKIEERAHVADLR